MEADYETMTTPSNDQSTNNQDQTSNISRAGSELVSSSSDDDYNCCFNCNWGEPEPMCQQRAEAYVPTASVYVPEVAIPLTQIPESATESPEASESIKDLPQVSEVIPEVHVQPPTPLGSPKLRQQRLIREYRKNQIDLERSLDHPCLQVPSQSRRSHLHLNIQNEDGCRSTASGQSQSQPVEDISTSWITENRRLFFRNSLRRRTSSVPSLIPQNRKPCNCMSQINPQIFSNRTPNVPPRPPVMRQASNRDQRITACRAINPQALQHSRAYHLHVHSPPDENCIALSGLPVWPANVVYGWLIFICSHHQGFREVYLCHSNLAFVEFSSEIYARDACAHLNGLRLTQSCVLRVTHTRSQYDMPPPYPSPGSEHLI